MRRDFNFGSYPYGLVAGDFVGNDEIVDLAVTHSETQTVVLMQGNGGGSFSRAETFDANTSDLQFPTSIVANDFDGDERLELAVANSNLLTSAGEAEYEPWAIASGDFNQDGKADLAVSNLFGDCVSVLLGNGDNTFQPSVHYATGEALDSPFAVVAAYLDDDPFLDLATANSNSDTISIFMGRGDGTFSAGDSVSRVNVGKRPVAIVAADLDSDADLDLVVANNTGGTITTLINDHGSFTPREIEQLLSSLFSVPDPRPQALASGDFDGDGHIDDVAVALSAGAERGEGGYLTFMLFEAGTLQGKTTYPLPGEPVALAIGDFDGDDRSDLAASLLGMGESADLTSILLVRNDYVDVSVLNNGITMGEPVILRAESELTITATLVPFASFDSPVEVWVAAVHESDLGNPQISGPFPLKPWNLAYSGQIFSGNTRDLLPGAWQVYMLVEARVDGRLDVNEGYLESVSLRVE